MRRFVVASVLVVFSGLLMACTAPFGLGQRPGISWRMDEQDLADLAEYLQSLP